MNQTQMTMGANPKLNDLQIFLNENFDFRYKNTVVPLNSNGKIVFLRQFHGLTEHLQRNGMPFHHFSIA